MCIRDRVTGDAYVDHPSFGMAICGRMLEAQGFRVGIIAQPDWSSKDDFMRLGKPNLFFGVTAGNIDVYKRQDIDHKRWNGVTVTPKDTVEIQGEVDKDWNSVEIDVKQIRKVKP